MSTTSSTCRAAAAAAADDNVEDKKSLLRMLVLHGKGSSGEDFTNRLTSYQEAFMEHHQMQFEIVSLDAPFPLGEGGGEQGYAWWTMPPGVRSFQATEYEGFETTSDLVIQTIQKQGPFDLIYGHSQGAILTASLLALQRIEVFPRYGFLLNGVAWPNPFREAIHNLKYSSTTSPPPRVLIITGERDKINPPETQEQVKLALEKAGAHVDVITHPAGHNIPTQKDETLDFILNWILK